MEGEAAAMPADPALPPYTLAEAPPLLSEIDPALPPQYPAASRTESSEPKYSFERSENRGWHVYDEAGVLVYDVTHTKATVQYPHYITEIHEGLHGVSSDMVQIVNTSL